MTVSEDRRTRGQHLLDELAAELTDLPGVDRTRMFGSDALRTAGKVTAFVGMDGELVVKLPERRASALVADGAAERVRIGRNPTREWVGLTWERADLWRDILREAHRYVTELSGG